MDMNPAQVSPSPLLSFLVPKRLADSHFLAASLAQGHILELKLASAQALTYDEFCE